jgi:hypothetical protein
VVRAEASRASGGCEPVRKLRTLWCAALSVFVLAGSAPAAWEDNQCVQCHETERLPISLGHSFEEWHASAHARGGVACEKCHGGDAAAKDPVVAHRGVLPASDAQSMVSPKRLAATCGGCHQPELQAYQGTVHAKQVAEDGQGATCLTCHGSMATSLPSPTELSARCAACHKKPVRAQMALVMLASSKIRLRKTHRGLETARADPEWHAEAMKRFHALERSYADIALKWHTFAMDAVIHESGDLLKLTKLLDEETALRASMRTPHE